jgi:hypothetical protein
MWEEAEKLLKSGRLDKFKLIYSNSKEKIISFLVYDKSIYKDKYVSYF